MAVTAANEWAGAELLARRTKIGKTQKEIADDAGIDRSIYIALEKGRRPITATYAERLAPIFGLKNWKLLLPPQEPPAAASHSRSPLDLLRGVATTVAKQQQTIQGLTERVEALERAVEGTQRKRAGH